MKKLTLLFSFFICLTVTGMAQQNYQYAIGLRGGNPVGATVKYFFTEYHAGEGIIGLEFNRGFNLTGLYEFNMYLTEGTNWYFGGGMSLGVKKNLTTFGFDGIIGVEFTLPRHPINFGIDWKPAYVFGLEDKTLGLLNFALSLRYAIK
ncbi:MAG: hypothetical protein AAF502_16825 [Bacteroidota bacterium]